MFLLLAVCSLWSQNFGFDSITMIPGEQCRVIEKVGSTLKYDRLDSFLVTIDLNYKEVVNTFEQYKASKDELGEACMEEIIYRLNHSLSEFYDEVSSFKEEKDMLDIYLNDPEFLGREKRSSGAMILAILVSISNFAATGLNIALSQLRLNSFDTRLTLMAERIQALHASQSVISNNLELLFEKDEFLGIQTNLIKNHVNLVKTHHSCIVVSSHMDSMISNMERKMFEIKKSMYSNELSIGLIRKDAISSVTRQALFEQTIYRISPSLLYEYAHADLVSFKGGKATFLVSYPVIGRKYEFDYFEIYEAPQLVGQTSDLPMGFLMPRHMTLTQLLNNTKIIRSPAYCKLHSLFRACPDVFFKTDCIRSMLLNENISKNCPIKNGTQAVTYTKTGALIDLGKNDQIFDHKKQSLLYAGNETNITQCLFIPERDQLLFISESSKYPLFPTTKIRHFEVKPIVQRTHIKLHLNVGNLSFPNFNSSLARQHLTVTQEIDYTFVIGIAIGSSLLFILLFHLIVFLCKHRICVIDGKSLF